MMQLTLSRQKFSGKNPTLVLATLARLVAEPDILEMSEAQAYIALPYVVKRTAEDQYNLVHGSLRASEKDVTCWSEAFQYLLRSYATGTAIQSAILALRGTNQSPMSQRPRTLPTLRMLSTGSTMCISQKGVALCS